MKMKMGVMLLQLVDVPNVSSPFGVMNLDSEHG
jgi:hypothetical protein